MFLNQLEMKFGSIRSVGDEEVIHMISELTDLDNPTDADSFSNYIWKCRGVEEKEPPLDPANPDPNLITIPGLNPL